MKNTTALLSFLGYRGRDLKNNTAHASNAIADLDSNNAERKEFAERALPNYLANALSDAEAIASELPALRALASGEAVPTKVESLGSSILVRYRKPTNTKGAGWIATLWRDSEQTFRGQHHFTYENSDNDGADKAAEKCLAKFTAYCNTPEFDLPQVTHRLTGRASLGNGSYAYTFTATR
jgi:hypothetical protein